MDGEAKRLGGEGKGKEMEMERKKVKEWKVIFFLSLSFSLGKSVRNDT